MKIEIVTPEKHLISDNAEEVLAYGPKGEFGVLPGHAHYVTPLLTGRLVYRNSGERHAFMVQGGFLEVFQEKVLVLADHVEAAKTIDRAGSQKRLEEIDRRLGTETLSPEDFTGLLQARELEAARLQTA